MPKWMHLIYFYILQYKTVPEAIAYIYGSAGIQNGFRYDDHMEAIRFLKIWWTGKRSDINLDNLYYWLPEDK